MAGVVSWRARGMFVRLACTSLLFTLLHVGAAVAQTRVITGRVTSATSGEPLPGVEVAVMQGGTTRASVLTTAEGNFTLRAPAGALTLQVRALGYARRDVPVTADQTTLQVSLETDALRLDEVVVTGQATGVQRRNLANAVATIKADQINVAPAGSIETLLSAKIAGADVQSNSGAPGGGNQINLRGVSSIIGNSTPLYVIDGVIVSDATVASGTNSVTNASSAAGISSNQDNAPNRIADLNPADIESIEILKGASAAAIYGSKANNGVILITTKRGAPGDVRYAFSQRFGASKLSNKIGRRVFHDSATAVREFGVRAAPFFAGGVPEPFDLEEALAGGTAPAWESALNISGGSDNTRFFMSGLARNEEGIVIGTYYDKYSLKLNLDQRINDRMRFDLSTSAIHTATGRGYTNNDNTSTSYYVAWSGTPSFVDLRKRADGTYPRNDFRPSNPLQTAALARNDESVYRFIGSLRGTLDAISTPTHTLRLTTGAGADIFALKDKVYSPEDLQFEQQDGIPGTVVNGASISRQMNLSLNGVYTFAPEQMPATATTSFGISYEFRDLDITRNRTRNLFPGQQNAGQGTDHLAAQQLTRSKDLGFFAQEELLVSERLLLTGGLRADRSSNNSDVEQWFLYPKAAASYRLSPWPGKLDELKVRAAWGRAGNQPLYGQKFNLLNPGQIGGLQTLEPGNTAVALDLRPERQTELEGGVDAALLGNRLSLEFTGYRRVIDDLLLNRTLAPSTGFNSALYNSRGTMRTTGIEAAMTVAPIETRNLNWTTRIAFSRDRSVMDSLDVPPFNAPNAGFGASLGNVRLQQGKSATQIVGRDTISVVDDPRCLEFLNVQPGSGRCQPGTRIETALGDANPDFRVGFNSMMRYGHVSLIATVDWQKGGDAVNLTGYLLDINRNSKDFDEPCRRSDCLPNETMGQYRTRVYPARTSRLWIEDVGFVKLRELAMYVDVPRSLLSGTRVLSDFNSMRIGLSGRNLLTHAKYTGFDPEVNNFGSQAIRANIEVTPYPPSRSFWLSVDFTF
ncbi:MAG: SusC/RagA family TonB-linked outer membrane protein [Longimicrobiales bacterium]